MTCSECQLQIFDAELDQDAVVHLTECDDCRSLDQEVRLNASAMASMREDAVPVRRARRWPWVVAAAAVLVAAIGLSYVRTPAEAPRQVAVIQPQPLATPPLPRTIVPKPAPVQRARSVKPMPPSDEPLLVKFLTDDPDVVIYWLIEPQGEQAI